MDEKRIFEALLQLGVLVFSLCLHEFGHAWAADRLGDPTPKMLGRLTIDPRVHVHPIGTILFPLLMIFFPGLPLIGWAKPVPVTAENFLKPRRDMSLVAMAGPFMNILLAAATIGVLCLFYQSHYFGMDEGSRVILLKLLMLFLLINFYLAVFNLIPIPPLDGGWLLKAALPGKWSYQISRLEPYSLLLFYVLLQFGILNLFFVPAGILLGLVLNLVGLGPLAYGMGI
jgi:Zn-dependent protease